MPGCPAPRVPCAQFWARKSYWCHLIVNCGFSVSAIVKKESSAVLEWSLNCSLHSAQRSLNLCCMIKVINNLTRQDDNTDRQITTPRSWLKTPRHHTPFSSPVRGEAGAGRSVFNAGVRAQIFLKYYYSPDIIITAHGGWLRDKNLNIIDTNNLD